MLQCMQHMLCCINCCRNHLLDTTIDCCFTLCLSNTRNVMDHGKGKAPASVPIPTGSGLQKLPQKFYCAQMAGCLHAIANAVAKSKFKPGDRIMGRQILAKTALLNPAAWVACGHVCCWDPVPGSTLPADANTCAKMHAKKCGSRGSRLSHKEAMTMAVAEGLVPPEWLALAGLTGVITNAMHASNAVHVVSPAW